MIDQETILNKLKEVGIPDEYAQKAAEAIGKMIADKMGGAAGAAGAMDKVKGGLGGLLGGD